MAAYELSASGTRIYPLTKGLYATVSSWDNKPRIHIRAFVDLKEASNNTQVASNATYSSTDVVQTPLYPTKRGICLDEAGFDKLITLQHTLLTDVETVKLSMADTANTSAKQHH